MYEVILNDFFDKKEQLATQLLTEKPKSSRKVVTDDTKPSYEASKIYKGFQQEQVRRAAKSKKKKDGV
jgi:SOS response regulatory protein OraA/RecX